MCITNLCITMLCVGLPATWFHLVGVQPPELELFLEKWSAHICGIVEFACAVVVEDLSEDTRVPVKEVLIKHWVVVSQCFRQSRQSCGGDLLQRCFVSFVPNAAHVQYHPIFRIRVHSAL